MDINSALSVLTMSSSKLYVNVELISECYKSVLKTLCIYYVNRLSHFQLIATCGVNNV